MMNQIASDRHLFFSPRQWTLDCGGFLESEIHIEKALSGMNCQTLPDIVSVVENASLVLIGADPAWDSRMQNGLQQTGLESVTVT